MKRKQKMDKLTFAIIVTAVACVVALIVMLACSQFAGNSVGTFVAPAFEADAQQGTPDVPENLGWGEIWQEGMEFRAGVCGIFAVEDGKADIYFTNCSETGAWLKLRVLDEAGNILGETGILRSGEYVKSIALDTLPKDGAAVTMKIMAYEAETYHSLGSVALSTTAYVLEGE